MVLMRQSVVYIIVERIVLLTGSVGLPFDSMKKNCCSVTLYAYAVFIDETLTT